MVKKSPFFTKTIFHYILLVATAFVLYAPHTVYAGANDAPPPPPPGMNGQGMHGQGQPEGQPPEMMSESFAGPNQMRGFPVAILPSYAYYVSFLQNPQISESAFTMRISKFGVVSGCAHIQENIIPPDQAWKWKEIQDGVGIQYIGEKARFTLFMPEIVNNSSPRYTDYDCEKKHMESYVDIKLDRNDLLEKGITQFAFNSLNSELGTYNIEVTEDNITLGENVDPEIPSKWLTLWFFPKNTVELRAPGAKAGTDLIQKIRDFGLAHGLSPMDEVLDGYTLPALAQDYVYFVDSRGIFTPDLSPESNDEIVGNIALSKTYYGPNGPETKDVPSPIHASLVLKQTILE